ncbi:hypothetical protein O5287_28350, partial [Escherichia coli]|nr:hypothetical protein [Escherichia coli]
DKTGTLTEGKPQVVAVKTLPRFLSPTNLENEALYTEEKLQRNFERQRTYQQSDIERQREKQRERQSRYIERAKNKQQCAMVIS